MSVLVAAAGAGSAWLLVALVLERWGRRRPDPARTFDVLVVLGCGVDARGEPSRALAERVKLAVALYEGGCAPWLVTTGGASGSAPTEAEVAARLAIELGVPPRAIRMESRSTRTEENARYCALKVQARSVLVVTDAYHAVRARRVFGRYFADVETAGSVHPAPWARLRGALREVPALVFYAVQRWL